ncbi:MAG: KH domain-containing protein [Candidatus Pacebacteria bacterium]|nr:KH domain-containing protein [Candidatus Paceibacterota bacterium]
MESDQQFLETLVKALVDHPEDVTCSRTVDEMGVLLTLDVHADDMGKIIGRSGNTAKAIRTLLRVVGMKNDARVNLKINEPEGGRPPAAMEQGGDATEVVEMGGDEPMEEKTLDEAIDDLKI